MYFNIEKYLDAIIADIVKRIGLTAEFKGRINTAIQAETSAGTLAPPNAANPINIIGTWALQLIILKNI